jgi:hypothetical protein
MSQLCLFASPAPVERSVSQPPELHSLHSIARAVIDRRSRVHGVAHACACCGCTDDNPCRLADGETCILNGQSGFCSRIACQKAAQRAGGKVA